MYALDDRGRPARMCDGLSRREWLRVGGIGAIGLGLGDLLRAQALGRTLDIPPDASALGRGLDGATFGRAKNVIFLWLQGGPPQHETFDPKPDAPEEIRGPFGPIATNVPGIHFSELLPRIARRADKLAVVRSIATDDTNHDVSGYWVLTGYPYGPGSARQIKPTDWPYFGSIVKMMRPSETLPALTSVWLPDLMRLNEGVTPAGQTAGFLGKQWEPERFVGDPSARDYRVDGLALPPELPRLRVDRRQDLLRQIDGQFASFERARGGALDSWDRTARQAYDLVSSGKAREAFDLNREPEALRDRYGRYSWGQSVLLARRLIEAGVRLVHVNWTREPGDSAVDNPMWDTHAQNADRLQDVLCPQFDVTFSTLLDDLESRGLLDETLVVAVGEFGRTPKINGVGGRDHWGAVFSFAMAGAGISGGQVFGSSDKNGAYPATNPIRPHDLTATIFHLLGIDHRSMFLDKTDRPLPITKGDPLRPLLGAAPATLERCEAGGDPELMPPYDPKTLLLDADFASDRAPLPPAPYSRTKGWRGWPLATVAPEERKGLVVSRRDDAGGPARLAVERAGKVAPGGRALLAQEIRSARGGHYTFTARIAGVGSNAETFAHVFNTLRCRLVLVRYASTAKDPREAQELASVSFEPRFGNEPAQFELAQFLGSTQPNVNFSIGNGLGVVIVVENPSGAPIEPVADDAWAALDVHGVDLVFNPRLPDPTVVD